MDPLIHYASTPDDVGIAYWAMGDGPPLVIPPILVTSHLELEWQIVSRRAVYEGLAHGLRVVRYDCRGMGMSQRDRIDFSVDAAIRDLEAVVDRLELDRFALLRLPSSGEVAFAYAARHPERVSHLIVWEGHAVQDDRDPPRARQIAAIEPVMDADWELYIRIRARIIAGWDGSNAPILEDILRATHTPASAKAMNEAAQDVDPTRCLIYRRSRRRRWCSIASATGQREARGRLYASRIATRSSSRCAKPRSALYPERARRRARCSTSSHPEPRTSGAGESPR